MAKPIIFVLLLALLGIFPPVSAHSSPSKIEFDFELDNLKGWDIPDWAIEQKDHVANTIIISTEKASQGKKAIELACDFPGDKWAAALIEYANDVDLSQYQTISADIYLPKKCKSELMQARIILTVGVGWWIIPMKRTVLLKKGEWTTVTANLHEPADWITRHGWEIFADNLAKVKKIAIRVEYNANPWQAGPPYKGPIYIDNIRIE